MAYCSLEHTGNSENDSKQQYRWGRSLGKHQESMQQRQRAPLLQAPLSLSSPRPSPFLGTALAFRSHRPRKHTHARRATTPTRQQGLRASPPGTMVQTRHRRESLDGHVRGPHVRNMSGSGDHVQHKTKRHPPCFADRVSQGSSSGRKRVRRSTTTGERTQINHAESLHPRSRRHPTETRTAKDRSRFSIGLDSK